MQDLGSSLVFVYGTLMEGGANHEYLLEATPEGQASTIERFAFFGGAFPFMTRLAPVCRVHGEIYRVEPHTLAEIDYLEGHPDLYCREEIEVQRADGRIEVAHAYVSQCHGNGSLVLSGRFGANEAAKVFFCGDDEKSVQPLRCRDAVEFLAIARLQSMDFKDQDAQAYLNHLKTRLLDVWGMEVPLEVSASLGSEETALVLAMFKAGLIYIAEV